jgi:phenylacetic acid degradation operon negative regulatory protein
MKPRSLILDIFGDYLPVVGAEVRAGDLVKMLGALGIEPATTRMTLSRLRQEGWFATRRIGRETQYRLSPQLLEILEEGRKRIFAPYQESWDGVWTQMVFQLPESDRSLREQFKKRLSWLGFGPLTPSTWMSPRRQRSQAPALRAEFPGVDIDALECRTDDVEDDRSLTRRCWDLARLNADYVEFLAGHRHLAAAASTFDGRTAFVTRIAMASTYRHFPFRDPSLPKVLRPVGWQGAVAHEFFLEMHDVLAPRATEFVAELVGERAPEAALRAENI